MKEYEYFGSFHGFKLVPEWVPDIWLHKKSQHSRRRWLFNKIRRHVASEHIRKLTDDFIRLISTMNSFGLLKGNLSRYDYYIIRLCSRRGIEPIKPLRDMKDSKTTRAFDDRLFGIIYRELQWDQSCECPYFLEWKDLTTPAEERLKVVKIPKATKSKEHTYMTG